MSLELILIIVVLVLLFGGGFGYYRNPQMVGGTYGLGGILVLVLVIVLIFYLLGPSLHLR